MTSGRILSGAALLLLCFSLSACGAKTGPAGKTAWSGVVCQDVVSLPQNLSGYAAAAGEDIGTLFPHKGV